MTKFQKVSYIADLLEAAYNAVKSHDDYWNHEFKDGNFGEVMEDRAEHHKTCLEIMDKIEKLL